MIRLPGCSFSFNIAKATFDNPIKHSSERAKEVLRWRPLLNQLLLSGEICCCRWCLTKEQRVALVGLTKKRWFRFRATFRVSEYVFIPCCNERKSLWKCSSVPLIKTGKQWHVKALVLKQVLRLLMQEEGKEICMFAWGSWEGRGEMIPGIEFIALNLCWLFPQHWSEKAAFSPCLLPPVFWGKNPCSPNKSHVWKWNTSRYRFSELKILWPAFCLVQSIF